MIQNDTSWSSARSHALCHWTKYHLCTFQAPAHDVCGISRSCCESCNTYRNMSSISGRYLDIWGLIEVFCIQFCLTWGVQPLLSAGQLFEIVVTRNSFLHLLLMPSVKTYLCSMNTSMCSMPAHANPLPQGLYVFNLVYMHLLSSGCSRTWGPRAPLQCTTSSTDNVILI
jgi:hypothetical protein